MKHVVKEQYKDLELKRILTEGAVLEEEYKKDNVELTEERISYLVDERKLCVAIEDKEEDKEESDEQTKENNNEEVKQEDKEESKDKDNAKAKDKNKNNK